MKNWRKTLALRLTLLLSLGSLGLLLWAMGLTVAGETGSGARNDTRNNAANEASNAVAGRVREGTKLTNQAGFFRLTGDRLTFYTPDGQRFGGLENLGLERVAKMVAESPDPLEWSVCGTVTEYQGANFLLVSRVELKSRQGRSEIR